MCEVEGAMTPEQCDSEQTPWNDSIDVSNSTRRRLADGTGQDTCQAIEPRHTVGQPQGDPIVVPLSSRAPNDVTVNTWHRCGQDVAEPSKRKRDHVDAKFRSIMIEGPPPSRFAFLHRPRSSTPSLLAGTLHPLDSGAFCYMDTLIPALESEVSRFYPSPRSLG